MPKNFAETNELKSWILKNDPNIKKLWPENHELIFQFFDDLLWVALVRHVANISEETGIPGPRSQ